MRRSLRSSLFLIVAVFGCDAARTSSPTEPESGIELPRPDVLSDIPLAQPSTGVPVPEAPLPSARAAMATPSPLVGGPLDVLTPNSPDILWRNVSTGSNAIWKMSGPDNLGTEFVLDAPTSWGIAAVGDMDNNGTADVVWRDGASGANALWVMNGTDLTQFRDLNTVSDTNWRMEAVADFTGDGYRDILWRHGVSGDIAIWAMQEDAMIGFHAVGNVSDLNWEIVGAGDMSGDGQPDIVWRHASSGSNAVWFMTGTSHTGYADLDGVTSPSWQIVSVSDLTLDEKPDLLWRNSDSGSMALWRMQGTTLAEVLLWGGLSDMNWRVAGVGEFDPPVSVTTTSLPDGAVGSSYGSTLAAYGGNGSYAWSIVEGALPSGLSLNGSSGAITGTPDAAGTANFTVQASSAGKTATKALSINVSAAAALSISTTTLAEGPKDVAYNAGLVATGGTGSYAWTLESGTLPNGLSLSGPGVISGLPDKAGTRTFTVRVTSGDQTLTKKLSIEIKGPFNIELVYVTELTDAQRTAFEDAEARWEEVIIADLQDVTGSFGACDFVPAFSGTIDDVRIYVNVATNDGVGGVLGFAGPCTGDFRGTTSVFPIHGLMSFDSDDLDNMVVSGILSGVVLHEMGHVLGIGTLWSYNSLLSPADCDAAPDPAFNGAQGLAAFNAAGGTSYLGAKVPVENSGGSGTKCGHWRESVLDNEIMTGYVDFGGMPLSAITLSGLSDAGYTVDMSKADAYSLPLPSIATQGGENGPLLRDDIFIGMTPPLGGGGAKQDGR